MYVLGDSVKLISIYSILTAYAMAVLVYYYQSEKIL